MKPPSYIDRHVGSRLRFLRLARNMSPQDLARALGVSIDRLALLEAGEERVSAELMRSLTRVLRASPSEFFSGLARAAAPSDETSAATAAEEEQQLLKNFGRIRDAKARALILSLVAAYAEFGDGQE